MSTLESMFECARSLINEHNSISENKVEIADFEKKIKLLGGTSVSRLRSFSYENILQAMPEVEGLKPVALAREIANKWRASSKDATPRIITKLAARGMTAAQLIDVFDPNDQTTEVAERLGKLSNNKPFLVFDGDGIFDKERSLAALEELQQGFEPRSHFDGFPLLRIGDKPGRFANENPFFVGRPLRPSDFCDQLNRSWQGIPLEVRQFVRLLVLNDSDMDPTSVGWRDRAHALLNLAVAGNAMVELRNRHPEIATKFDRDKNLNKLPVLRVELGGSAKSTGSGRPFDNPRRVL